MMTLRRSQRKGNILGLNLVLSSLLLLVVVWTSSSTTSSIFVSASSSDDDQVASSSSSSNRGLILEEEEGQVIKGTTSNTPPPDNATFPKPTKQVFADVLVDEIKTDGNQMRPEEVLAKAMEKIVLKQRQQNDGITNTTTEFLNQTSWMDEILDELEDGDDEESDPQFQAIDEALQQATGSKSLCSSGASTATTTTTTSTEGKKKKKPTSCRDKDEEKKQIIKDWMAKKLSNAAKDKTLMLEPSLSQLYEELEEETGIDEDEAEKLVKESKGIQKLLRRLFKQATSNVRKREAKNFGNMIQQVVLQAGKHNENLEDSIKKLGLSGDMVQGALNSLGKGQAKKIRKVARKAEQDLEDRITKAEIKHSNHTYFVDEGPVGNNGTNKHVRRLRYVRHPSEKSWQDQLDEIDQRLHRRRLSRPVLPEDTSHLERLVTDHVDELQGHIEEIRRELRDRYPCPVGWSKKKKKKKTSEKDDDDDDNGDDGEQICITSFRAGCDQDCAKEQCIDAGGKWKEGTQEQDDKKPYSKCYFATEFVVVAKDFVRVYDSLKAAKAKLKSFDNGSRLIAEVDGTTGQVKDGSPQTVAGQKQLSDNGFHKYWRDDDDITRMIDIANAYLKKAQNKEGEGKQQEDEKPTNDEPKNSNALDMGKAVQKKKSVTLFASKNTGTKWIADNLGDLATLADNLTNIVKGLIRVLDPFGKVLKVVKWAQIALDVMTKAGDVCMAAITAACAIPKVGQVVFIPVRTALTPIHAKLGVANTVLSTFQATIGTIWESSIGLVMKIIRGFETYGSPVLRYTAKGAEVIANIQNSQCIRGLVKKVAGGVDIMGGIEAAADMVRQAAESLMGAVKPLMDAFLSTAWKHVEGALFTFKKVLDALEFVFKPLNPLEDLLHKKVDLPWVSIPYKQKHFGPSTCDAGYATRALDKINCWEQNSHDNEYVKLSIPPQMTYTCKHQGMKWHWDGISCENNGYGREKRGFETGCECSGFLCIPKCYVRCPGGFSVGVPDILHCYRNCDGGYTAVGDHCWRTNCPEGYTTSLLKNLCVKSYRRPQKKRETNCNKYALEPGHSYVRNFLNGDCSQSCKPGSTLIGNICFPAASISLSLSDIGGAFKVIMDFIKKLPLVGEILTAIEREVKKVLKSIYNDIRAWLKKYTGIELPEFPDVSLSLLPFAAFDSISAAFAKPLDLIELARLPLRAFDDAVKRLPPPANSFAGCGSDLTCIMRGLGLGSISDFIEPVSSSIDLIQDTRSMIIHMITDLGCAKWGVMTVPLADLLNKVGVDAGETCDVDIDYCEALDLSKVQQTLEKLNRAFQPSIKHFVKFVHGSGRRLKDSTFHQKFISLLSFAVSPAGLAMGKGRNPMSAGKIETRLLVDSPLKLVKDAAKLVAEELGDKLGGTVSGLMSGGVKALDSLNQPIGFHFRIDPSVYFQLGIIIKDGEPSFGIKAGAKFDVQAGTYLGTSTLLVEAIRIASELKKFNKRPEYKKCEEGGYSQDACNHVRNVESRLDSGPSSCDVDRMMSLQGKMSWPLDTDQDRQDSATTCIEHWFNVDKKVSEEMYKFSVASSVADTANFFGDASKWNMDSLMNLVELDMDWIGGLLGGGGGTQIRSRTDEWPWENIQDKIKFSVGMSFAGDSDYLALGPSCSFGATAFQGCKLGGTFKPQKIMQKFLDDGVNFVMNGPKGWENTKSMILAQLSKVVFQVFGKVEFSVVFDPIAAITKGGGDGRRRLIVDASINETFQIPDDSSTKLINDDAPLLFPLDPYYSDESITPIEDFRVGS